MKGYCGIHAPLGHRVARQEAILSVTPGALHPLGFLKPHRPLIHAQLPAICDLAGHVYHEPALALIVKHCAAFGFIVDRVSHLLSANVKVVCEKEPDLARTIHVISHDDLAQIQVLVKVDHVVTDQAQGEIGMVQRNVRDQRAMDIIHGSLPALVVQPAKLPIDPDPKTTGVAGSVILLPHMRPVDVPQIVVVVKVDQQRSIPDGDISRHGTLPFSRCSSGVAASIERRATVWSGTPRPRPRVYATTKHGLGWQGFSGRQAAQVVGIAPTSPPARSAL